MYFSNKIFVQEGVHDKFLKLFKEVEAVKVGDGLETGVTMGPLVAERRVGVMDDFIADAVAKGAEVSVGGGRIQNPGSFFQPTLLENVSRVQKS